ncbi:amine oxidase [Aspergillus pseudoustus]|uniref:Amine oxidase n=1 Tax=Aspergillus pseudoustus TaxID=1810923 RepID=A0ABR4IDN8_9EURO
MSRTKEGYLWTPSSQTTGLPTASAQPIRTSKTPLNLKPQYDAIVIGAGFSGLIAARELSRTHSLNVLLLDARDRLGGRTWTANVLGEEIEMGGTWVHWNQPHLYKELHRYGLHKHLKTSAGTSAAENQFFLPGAENENAKVESVGNDEYAKLEELAGHFFTLDGLDSRALMPYPHDSLREPAPWKRYDHLSVRDRLDQLADRFTARERGLFESNVSTFGSAPANEIAFVEALRWLALGGHSMAGVFELAGVYKLGKGGVTAFARAIFEEFRGDAVFGVAVREVRQVRGGEVEVVTVEGEVMKGKVVISTIPLNCLSDIKFDPPLSPLRQEAITKGHINQGAKIHFKLRETLPGWFWTAESGRSRFVFAFSDHNGTQPSGPSGTWCIGFGYNGHLTDKKDSKAIIKAFHEDINPDHTVEAYATHDWMNDPYAKGVWACWGPRCTSKYLKALQEPHGRVVFASADWADGWRGFVDGAIERGQVAVRDTLRLLEDHIAVAAKL